MKKLKEIIEKARYTGKLPKGFAPYMMENLIYIYNSLANKETATFIELEIKNLLDKCKIKTKTDGIGWIAYR